jgi:hypothetical protein
MQGATQDRRKRLPMVLSDFSEVCVNSYVMPPPRRLVLRRKERAHTCSHFSSKRVKLLSVSFGQPSLHKFCLRILLPPRGVVRSQRHQSSPLLFSFRLFGPIRMHFRARALGFRNSGFQSLKTPSLNTKRGRHKTRIAFTFLGLHL